ncbi:hypothetical protein SAMN05444581_11234 [Methylocapsa palsarum]|uniref:PIN domain-containing protein n=1 Tax=Methylocapsa palsarum TaxID=1612308 RepID=A0A1I4AZ84_9HYPH|nr:hypothetical protein SAMN05444581_11234 [Methylocapsa palsarum]
MGNSAPPKRSPTKTHNANAALDATYLLADANIVVSYILFNINHTPPAAFSSCVAYEYYG